MEDLMVVIIEFLFYKIMYPLIMEEPVHLIRFYFLLASIVSVHLVLFINLILDLVTHPYTKDELKGSVLSDF